MGYYEVTVPETVTNVHVYSKKYGLLSSEYNGEQKIDFVYIDEKLAASDRISDSDNISIGYSTVDKENVAVRPERIEGPVFFRIKRQERC